jgi:creatinine amidohydrolase
MQMPNRNFAEMSQEEVAVADTSRWIAVMPLAATEYHGPHLPPETDAIIAGDISRRLTGEIDEAMPVTFLPVEAVGYSPEHLGQPATLSLEFDAAIERWIATGSALAAQGIRKLVLLNAHGGNSPLMTIVATELRVRESMLCVATSWTRFGTPENLISPEEMAWGIHGGEVETSAMLAIAPDRVRMELAEDFHSLQQRLAQRYRYLRAYGRHAFGWKMTDLNPSGAVGNAAAATAQKGEALLRHAVSGLAELLREIDDFDLAMLRTD